ncbi:MAG: sulfatase-like hydrolase/transferase [Verrucomicrobiota bacterium]
MDNKSARWEHAAHCMAWLGGVLIALTPFVREWSLVLGGNTLPVRLWPGNLIVEGIACGVLVLVGGTCGGYWWEKRHGGRWSGLILLAWGLSGWLGWLAQPVYWAGAAVLLGLVGVSLGRVNWGSLRAKASTPGIAWNGVLFGVILVLNVVSDCLVLGQPKGGGTGMLGMVLSRVLTQVVMVSLAWYGLQQFWRRAPAGTRWLGGVALGLALLALGADIGMRKLWGKGLVLFCGELTVGGKFDLLRVLEGGGVRVSVAGGLGIASVLLLVAGLLAGTARLSQRLDLRLRPWYLLLVAVGAWGLLLAEQTSETLWNNREGRWWQRRTCMIHLCPGECAPGLASFTVQFREPERPAALAVSRRPDVFLFVVETLRGDALRPDIMPFLSQWRDAECQPMSESRSAANATHLSWYAILSGKPSVFWDKDRQAQRPASLLDALHAAGYRNEVRSSAIFNYAEMDTTNFGHGEATDVLVSLTPDNPEWPAGISERDLHVLDQWCQSVLTEKAGNCFRLVAVEAPHYPYNWASGFNPPFADFANSSWFPAHPSVQDTERVKHRYWNSLAWVDNLLRDYIGFLQAQGRYDDAMIVITGDHGEEMQEHGTWFHASGLTREQTSVPVIVKWPKALGRGEPVAQASHLDIMPSILDALGCPPAQWSSLAGHSLRQGGEQTVLVMTHYASLNGEGMLWRRNGYEAAFAWEKFWVPGVPGQLWLERMSGPQGNLEFKSAAAAEAALHEYFPDAIGRWFDKFE